MSSKYSAATDRFENFRGRGAGRRSNRVRWACFGWAARAVAYKLNANGKPTQWDGVKCHCRPAFQASMQNLSW